MQQEYTIDVSQRFYYLAFISLAFLMTFWETWGIMLWG